MGSLAAGVEILWENPFVVAIVSATLLAFTGGRFIAATSGANAVPAQGRWIALALLAWLIGGLAVLPGGSAAHPVAAHVVPATIRIIASVLILSLTPDARLIRDCLIRRTSRLVVLSALMVYVALLPLILHLASRQDPNSMQDQARDLVATSEIAVRTAMAYSLVLATPIYEELVYRGLLMHGIAAHLPSAVAIGITTVAFTLVHQPVEIWPSVFVLGLLLAFIARRAHSLWPSILVHAVHNGLTFAFYVMRG